PTATDSVAGDDPSSVAVLRRVDVRRLKINRPEEKFESRDPFSNKGTILPAEQSGRGGQRTPVTPNLHTASPAILAIYEIALSRLNGVEVSV
ncbi:MAG TPA: hypothetical protein VFR76_06450, partial [Verrucomicrobiae bacterium]|nr:hypothetical protein [Verrucomicrobiae bacterium]